MNKPTDEQIKEFLEGRGMICDRGRAEGMRLFPPCTWEGGVECSGLEEHKYDPETCKRKFCMRAGVWRKCTVAHHVQLDK